MEVCDVLKHTLDTIEYTCESSMALRMASILANPCVVYMQTKYVYMTSLLQQAMTQCDTCL